MRELRYCGEQQNTTKIPLIHHGFSFSGLIYIQIAIYLGNLFSFESCCIVCIRLCACLWTLSTWSGVEQLKLANISILGPWRFLLIWNMCHEAGRIEDPKCRLLVAGLTQNTALLLITKYMKANWNKLGTKQAGLVPKPAGMK